MFSEHPFQGTGLGAASDISWGVISRKNGDLDPRYLLWIHSLTWFGQFKQKFYSFDWKYLFFFQL